MLYKLLIALSICLSSVLFAQGQNTPNSKAMPKPVSETINYRPAFPDKSLLFFATDLVWNCKQGNDSVTWYSYFKTDFSKVQECQCNKETYLLVPPEKNYHKADQDYEYTPIEKATKANLVKVDDNTLKYTEFGDDGTDKKVVELKFDLEKPIFIDSAYAATDKGTELIITRWINLEAK